MITLPDNFEFAELSTMQNFARVFFAEMVTAYCSIICDRSASDLFGAGIEDMHIGMSPLRLFTAKE
jgi:hypothetical protein